MLIVAWAKNLHKFGTTYALTLISTENKLLFKSSHYLKNEHIPPIPHTTCLPHSAPHSTYTSAFHVRWNQGEHFCRSPSHWFPLYSQTLGRIYKAFHVNSPTGQEFAWNLTLAMILAKKTNFSLNPHTMCYGDSIPILMRHAFHGRMQHPILHTHVRFSV